MQAYSAAKTLADFNTSLALFSSNGLQEGCGDCPDKCDEPLEIQCTEASSFDLKSPGQTDEQKAACPEGFKSLKCCICYIQNTKVKNVREAGHSSHEKNVELKNKVGLLHDCLAELMKHKTALLKAFQFDAKDLDTEVQNEMQKVITATENFGKAGKGEAGEGDTGSTPAAPAVAPGPAPAAQSSTSSLTHLGGMRNLSSPKTFIQNRNGQTSEMLQGPEKPTGPSSPHKQTVSSLGQVMMTSEVMAASQALARQRAVAKMSVSRSRILSVLKSMAEDPGGAEAGGDGDACQKVEAASFSEVSLGGGSLLEQTSATLHDLLTSRLFGGL